VHFLSSVKKDVQCNATRMPELIDICRKASMDAKVVCWESCRKTMLIPDPHGPSASNGGDGSCNRSEIAARPRLGQGLGSLDMTTFPFGFPQTSSTSIARYLDTMFAGQGAAIRAFIVNGFFVTDRIPFNAADSVSFRDMLRLLRPAFVDRVFSPNLCQLAGPLLERLYSEVRTSVDERLCE
jgi:hypothetical protein